MTGAEISILIFGDKARGIPRGVDGLVFDFDGTLADSMQVWYWVDEEFLRRRNLEEPADYGKTLSTLGFREAAAWVVDVLGLNETAQNVMDEWNELALEFYANNVYLKPHVREFVERARAAGLATSIATTVSPELLFPALELNDVRGSFDAVAFSHECEHDKNEPDIYLLAADRMGVPPERCVVFEDILPGVKSAKRGGMYAVGVRDDSGHQEIDAMKRVADAFIDNFGELLQ